MKKTMKAVVVGLAITAIAGFAFAGNTDDSNVNKSAVAHSSNDYSGAAWGEAPEPNSDRVQRVKVAMVKESMNRAPASDQYIVTVSNDYSNSVWGN